jgi:pimeloyl-ACP methyl ester carboxylesterase
MDIELRNVEASSPLIRAFDLNDPALTEQRVDTEFGSILVAHQGADHRSAPARPVILTYPDLGLNHITNYQAFFSSPDMQLLLRSFSVLHVNPAGQEDGAADLPGNFYYPTMDQMAEQLESVCQHFGVGSVIGFGVGLGANVLTRFALQRPHRMDGLFLMNATAGRSSWTEWAFQV